MKRMILAAATALALVPFGALAVERDGEWWATASAAVAFCAERDYRFSEYEETLLDRTRELVASGQISSEKANEQFDNVQMGLEWMFMNRPGDARKWCDGLWPDLLRDLRDQGMIKRPF